LPRRRSIAAALLERGMRIGLYSGSFDPVTFGHIDIAKRAAKIVDRLIVAVGTHHDKHSMFSAEERVGMVAEAMRPVSNETRTEIDVTTYDNLTVDIALEVGASVIFRGLRDAGDFDYEMQMAGMNAALKSQVETVFLASSPETRYIAASFVRQIAAMGGDVSAFVPAAVAAALKGKFSR
jgi:pantetheine-phosphate adenylyltransferase